MLRFFRHIRKTLMEQNKVRAYFFYAIGEIALVMIGILLALQVNNWNEGRKSLQQADIWKKAITADLRSTKDQLLNRVIYYGQALEFAEQALPLIKGSFPESPELQWVMVLGAFQAGQIWPLQISGSTYREVQSRGSLNLIGNENILTRLSDFYDVTAYDIELVSGGKPAYRDRIREVTPWPIQKYIWENGCQSETEPINEIEFVYELISCDLTEDLSAELLEGARFIHNNQEIIEGLQGRMSQLKVSIDSFKRAAQAIDIMVESIEQSSH